MTQHDSDDISFAAPATPDALLGAGVPALPDAAAEALRAEGSHLDALSARFAETGDAAARDALIMHHQKLVHYVAARFIGSGETLEDLIQVGNIGLINAVDRYDPSREIKFSTFAMPTIVGEIKRHFRDKTWHVKVPRWLQELSVNARKTQVALSARLGRQPTIREIATALDASEDDTIEALEIIHIASAVSLDTRLDVQGGSDSATLMDVIGRIDSAMHDIDAYADLRRALEHLELRERQVVQFRFFDELSQAKIARKMGISQMHVSRLQQRALARLQDLLSDHHHLPLRRTGIAPTREPNAPRRSVML